MRTKKILFVLVVVLVVSLLPVQASANTFSGRYNTGSLTYSFAGIYSNTYQNQLATYFKQWDSATSHITMTKGSSYDNAKLRIRYKLTAPPEDGLLGRTYLYDINGNDASTSSTWYKATCSVYSFANDYGEVPRLATLVHEVGHSVSMAHCDFALGHIGLHHVIHQGVKNYTTISSFEIGELQDKWGN